MKATEEKRILIVDDRPTNLKILFNFLQAEGFQILIAKTGKSALQKLRKVLPDLILLDVMMQDMDGFETCERIKANPETQHIPVIFMTALSDGSDKTKGLSVGAVDYITKPLIKEEVVARINIHLKLRSITQQLQQKNQLLEQEIRDRQQAEQNLQYRLTLETALAEASKELATNQAANFNQILEILAVAVGVNRAYLTQFRDSSSIADMTHEWCDDRAKSQIESFQNIDTSQFPWWVEKYRQNENVALNDIEELPEAARVEKELLKAVGVGSVLAVPIQTTSGQPWGTIGFETIAQNRKNWSDEDIQLLRVVGEMLYSYCSKKQAQEKLRASEALYAGVFNHSTDGIFIVNVLPDDRFIYETINPIHERSTGISAAQIAGKTPQQVLSPEVATHVTERYRACIKAGVSICYEETLDLPGGTRMWQTILVPIRDATGRIVKLQGSARDITEQKLAFAEQLRQTRYRHLLTSLTLKIRESLEISNILQTTVTELQTAIHAERVLFFRLLPEGGGKIVNEIVASGFKTMLGKVFQGDCLPEPSLDRYRDGHIHACDDVEAVNFNPCYLEFLQEYQIRSNLLVPIMVTAELELSHSKKLWGIIGVQQCSDVRQWMPWEADLLQQLANQLSIALHQAELLENQTRYSQELARSNAELEQFAYVASHDLQAPLATVTGFAQLLKRRYDSQLDEKANHFIDTIISGTDRMQALIHDLLEYSRIGKSQKPFESIDCHRVFDEACANLQLAIHKNQASVTKNNLPVVMADRSQLVQLFQNLIGNGIKYRREEPPQIHVDVILQNDAWLFSVRDNGIGIESKYKDRIFQIFQRLHGQKEYSGTGIGLAICQKIVECHGGRIWVESEPEKGSTFYFTLPNRKQ